MTTEDFKNKIRSFLKEKNPYMHDHEIEERITGFWTQYKKEKTPEFDKWLQQDKQNKTEKLIELQQKILEKTNWIHIAYDIIEEFPIYYDKNNMWWLWNHNKECWEITDETDICNIIDTVSKKNTLRSGIKNEMLEAFKRIGRKKKPETLPKTWIQFKNKIVDLETKQELKPNPKYFLTNPIPHNLGESEETPKIDALLKEWGGEYAYTLKQIIAYCCLKDYPLHRIFLLIGSGCNGKGTYLRLLNRFIGQENVASVEMDFIVNNQFHITKLHNKLCCQMSETNFTALKNTSMLKKLSGGDLIGFEYKNKPPFDDYNYAKILIASNSLPVTHDKTDGFYRRWVIIEFKNQFDEKDDPLSSLEEREYENLCRWSLNAIRSLLTNRNFYLEGTIEQRKNRYESHSNPLQSFLMDNYERNANEKIGASDFFDHFSAWLQSRGQRLLTYQTVRNMMKEEGFEYEKTRLNQFENPISAIIGLKRKFDSVPAVPAVPVVSVLPYTRGTKVDVPELLEQVEQNTKINTLYELLTRISTNNIDIVVSIYGKELVDLWVKTGVIYENPAGTYRKV